MPPHHNTDTALSIKLMPPSKPWRGGILPPQPTTALHTHALPIPGRGAINCARANPGTHESIALCALRAGDMFRDISKSGPRCQPRA